MIQSLQLLHKRGDGEGKGFCDLVATGGFDFSLTKGIVHPKFWGTVVAVELWFS